MAAHWPWHWLLVLFASTTGNHHSRGSSSSSSSSSSTSWDQVQQLDRMSNQQQVQFLAPLMAISNNAYTHPNLSPVTNWKLAKVAPLSPSQVGCHAVAFAETGKSSRLVVAFRGTASQSDACVDSLLFKGRTPQGMILPSTQTCLSQYSNSSLDYVSQAISYTKKVITAYPNSQLLLTGHSLGAALAVVVSASLSSKSLSLPVVGFSCPGTKMIIKEQPKGVQQLDVEQWKKKVFVVGDQWDSVVHFRWSDQVGNVCLLQHPEPSECSTCSKTGDFGSCGQCLLQAHGMSNIQALLSSGRKLACQTKSS